MQHHIKPTAAEAGTSSETKAPSRHKSSLSGSFPQDSRVGLTLSTRGTAISNEDGLSGDVLLPFFKTIDEFDFTLQSTLRQSLLGSYLGPDFVTEGRSLILYGKTGRGKTHLAVAIGYRAIQNGFETLCTTAAELINSLKIYPTPVPKAAYSHRC